MKKSNLKKYILVGIISLIIIILIFLGVRCYKESKKIKINSFDNIKTDLVVKNEISVEIMSDVFKVEDFFDKKKVEDNLEINYKKDGEDVIFLEKYDKLGNYEVTIKNNDKEYKSILHVVDTTKTVLKLKDLSINVNDVYTVNDFVGECSDNSLEECILSFKDDKVYKNIGVYDIVIVAKDSSGNEIEETTKLEILKKQSSLENKKSTKTNNKVTFVKKETESEKEKKDLKYGVKLYVWHVKKYNIYSDGSKKLINEYTYNEVDTSGFKASTQDMLPEALENMKTYKSLVNSVLEYTNSYRKEIKDLGELQLDENLTKAAMVRAIEMAYSGKFSHERPDSSDCFSILNDLKINVFSSGENIATGYKDAKSVSEGWRNSEGHYQNMISSNFNKIGIGVIKFNNSYYWVQLFSN